MSSRYRFRTGPHEENGSKYSWHPTPERCRGLWQQVRTNWCDVLRLVNQDPSEELPEEARRARIVREAGNVFRLMQSAYSCCLKFPSAGFPPTEAFPSLPPIFPRLSRFQNVALK